MFYLELAVQPRQALAMGAENCVKLGRTGTMPYLLIRTPGLKRTGSRETTIMKHGKKGDGPNRLFSRTCSEPGNDTVMATPVARGAWRELLIVWKVPFVGRCHFRTCSQFSELALFYSLHPPFCCAFLTLGFASTTTLSCSAST